MGFRFRFLVRMFSSCAFFLLGWLGIWLVLVCSFVCSFVRWFVGSLVCWCVGLLVCSSGVLVSLFFSLFPGVCLLFSFACVLFLFVLFCLF